MATTHRALLIANSYFPHDPQRLVELEGPKKDRRILNSALCDREAGLFGEANVRLLYERPRAATCTDIWKWGSDRAAVSETNIITGGSRGDFVVAGPDGCAYATQSSSVEKLVRTNGTCSYYQSSCDRQTPENATDCGKTPRPRRQLEPWGKRCSGNGEVGRR